MNVTLDIDGVGDMTLEPRSYECDHCEETHRVYELQMVTASGPVTLCFDVYDAVRIAAFMMRFATDVDPDTVSEVLDAIKVNRIDKDHE